MFFIAVKTTCKPHVTYTACITYCNTDRWDLELLLVSPLAQLWFSRLESWSRDERLESWSRDVSRLVFQSLGLGLEHHSLGLGLETQSLGLGLEDLSLGLFVFLPTV